MDDKLEHLHLRAYLIWEREGRPEGREVDHWLQADHASEGLAALAVDVANGSAHLVVGVGGDVLHQEVDQAAFALQNPEKLQSAVGGAGNWRGRRGGRRFGGGRGFRWRVAARQAESGQRARGLFPSK